MKVIIFGRPNCSYCSKAVFLADMKKLETEYKNINDDGVKEEMIDNIPEELRESIRTVPQIFVDNQYIGGFTEFEKLLLTSPK